MSTENKKVCLVTDAIPPVFSGSGLRAFEFACRLHRKGYLAFILTRGTGKHKKEWKEGVLKHQLPDEKIVRVTSFVRIDKSIFLNRLRRFWIEYIMVPVSTMWKLFWLRNSFDIIHSFGAGKATQLSATLFGKILRKRTVLEITTVTKDSSLDFLKKSSDKFKDRLQLWLLSLADIVISISPALSLAYKGSGLEEKKLREVANPVDIERFYPAREEEKLKIREKFGIDAEDIVILYVGTIAKRKGIDLLVEAFEKIVNSYPQSLLVLAGPISLRIKGREEFVNEMKNRFKELGISEKVMFTGLIDNVNEYMKASDIFVFPSRAEGFGTVVVEAMATGLPVIAVNIPGVTESIIEDGQDGIIVREEEPGKIETAVNRLLQDEELYQHICKNALRKVLTNFTNEVIDKQYEQIYFE
jgi:glycosyltransferase involved in cell wall biosynthesis